MKYLVDTQVFLWFISDSPMLSAAAKEIIEDASAECLLSMASIWEISIKLSLDKLSLPKPLSNFLRKQLEINRFALLPIEYEHAVTVSELPFHHRDPFDRLIAVQSLSDAVPLISSDKIFDLYSVQRIW